MSVFDKLKKSDEGGYVFLSHSHSDIEKVREIRNALEEKGFEPLCFYLKCLNDDSEIEDLIKREIDAREWFVFANSENSRKSKWVTMEREYIKGAKNKKILSVDLDGDEPVRSIVDKISHNLRVFLSSTAYDRAIASRFRKKLEEKDFLVFYEDNMNFSFDDDVKGIVSSAICEASQEGCVLVLVTESSVKSPHVLNEIEQAICLNGNVVPVIFGDVTLSLSMKLLISKSQWYHLPKNPTDEEISSVIDKIGAKIIKRNN